MNIAIFRDGPLLPSLTGAAVTILNLISMLRAKRMKVFLIKCRRNFDDLRNYRKLKVPILFLKERDYYLNISSIVQFLREKKIQIARFDSAEAVNWQGNLIKFRMPQIKIVWEVHNINHVLFSRLKQSPKKVEFSLKQEKMALKSADLVLARSETDAKILQKIGGDPKKIRVFPVGIKIGKQPKRTFPKESKNIVFIGNLFYLPNFYAVRIIDRIIAPQLPKYTFFIIGKVNEKLVSLSKSPNVNFLGVVKNPYHIYENAFLGVAPLTAGSGTRIKILEYLNAGLPTISTKIGIEGLNPKIEKVVIVEDNFKKYAQHIKKLSQNSSQWLKLSRRGQCFVREFYNWSKNVNILIRIYKTLLNKGQ